MKTYFGVLLFLLSFLTACDSVYNITEDHKNDEILIGANINGIAMSRTYQEEGAINDGIFSITFLNFNREYEIGNVNFFNGVGFAKKLSGITSDLGWNDLAPDVINGTAYTLYLDNLPSTYNSTTIDFDSSTPFKASVFDNIGGTNDLLWGELKGVARSNMINFDLRHVMSRFTLKVFFDNDQGFNKLSPVSASLSNVFTDPVNFDRLTGIVGIDNNPENPALKNFVLVENSESWSTETNNDGTTYFVSPDYVIPPQQFISNMRPRLTVTVKDENNYLTSFSGLLPTMMYKVNDNGNLTPWQMEFLQGYKLTLTVRISNDPDNLQFLPVTALDWIDKGTFTIQGSQASVKDKDDLNKLIDAYKKGDTDILYKWGYYSKTDGEWIFNIFQNIILPASFAGKMPENPQLPYSFNLWGSEIEIELSDGKVARLSGEEGAQKLKELLSKGNIPDPTEDDAEDPNQGNDDSDDNLDDEID